MGSRKWERFARTVSIYMRRWTQQQIAAKGHKKVGVLSIPQWFSKKMRRTEVLTSFHIPDYGPSRFCMNKNERLICTASPRAGIQTWAWWNEIVANLLVLNRTHPKTDLLGFDSLRPFRKSFLPNRTQRYFFLFFFSGDCPSSLSCKWLHHHYPLRIRSWLDIKSTKVVGWRSTKWYV